MKRKKLQALGVTGLEPTSLLLHLAVRGDEGVDVGQVRLESPEILIPEL